MDLIEAEFIADELPPGGTRFDGEGVAVEVSKGADGRVGVEHDALRIMLHGGTDGDDGLVRIGDGFEHMVRRVHTELHGTTGHERLTGEVRTAGDDLDVKAFSFVIAPGDGVVETSVLGLWVPVCLKLYGREARRRRVRMAAGERG